MLIRGIGMRTALFIHNDESLMNRIKITVHDDNATYFFASSIDEAIGIMEGNEIAVVFMPFNFDVLDGREMIELVLGYNPRVQIIVLFEDSDLLSVVKAHNEYHLCQIVCNDFFKIEDLQSLLNTGFNVYNKEDDIKSFELDYRKKEDKYKKTLLNMSSLLNERNESYLLIRKSFTSSLNSVFEDISDEVKDTVLSYVDKIIDEYIQLYLINHVDYSGYLGRIDNDCNDNEKYQFLKIDMDSIYKLQESDSKLFVKIVFVIYCISHYFNSFYIKYRGKIELMNMDSYYSLNIVYEAIPMNEYTDIYDKLVGLMEDILNAFSNKTVYGSKDKILQFRLMYKK